MFASVDRRFAAAEVPFLVNRVEGDAAMQVALMPLYSQFMEKFKVSGFEFPSHLFDMEEK